MKIVVNLLRKSANLRNGIRISIGYIPVGENNQRVWDEKKIAKFLLQLDFFNQKSMWDMGWNKVEQWAFSSLQFYNWQH